MKGSRQLNGDISRPCFGYIAGAFILYKNTILTNFFAVVVTRRRPNQPKLRLVNVLQDNEKATNDRVWTHIYSRKKHLYGF